MKAPESNFSVSMNTPSSAPVKEERLGLGLYPVGVGGGDAHLIFLGLNLGKSCFFSWGVSKTRGFSGYVKLWPQEHFFTHY